MKIFADCADLTQMLDIKNEVAGFTTNPTLMRAAGVPDYEYFARTAIAMMPDRSFNFEVTADESMGIRRQAKRISSWGENIYVKVPACNTSGMSNWEIIQELSKEGIKVNVTAVFVSDQIAQCFRILKAPAIISVFAGRIADTGVNPSAMIQAAVEFADKEANHVEILWASTREVFNMYEASSIGVHIVTATPDLVRKLFSLSGKDLLTYSKETSQMFYNDAKEAGLSL